MTTLIPRDRYLDPMDVIRRMQDAFAYVETSEEGAHAQVLAWMDQLSFVMEQGRTAAIDQYTCERLRNVGAATQCMQMRLTMCFGKSNESGGRKRRRMRQHRAGDGDVGVAGECGNQFGWRIGECSELACQCDNCRVISQFEAGDNPLAAGARRPPRTSEDYLREREARARRLADEPEGTA